MARSCAKIGGWASPTTKRWLILKRADAIIVSLARWARDRDALLALDLELGIRLGIRLGADQSPAMISRRFATCRACGVGISGVQGWTGAFTYARLLRERYGFTGEVRATGNVLRDQFQFMVALRLRCFRGREGK